MFKIKICGITSAQDALLAAEAGADAIGLNFYERSPRHVTVERAAEVCRSRPQTVTAVPVFVNASETEMLSVVRYLQFPFPLAVQVHGDETPEMVGHLQCMLGDGFPVIRAFRCRDSSLDDVAKYLRAMRSTKYCSLPSGVLLDAFEPGRFGGTGRVVDWHAVRERRRLLQRHAVSVILAGGLTPENVAEAIATARPDAVDVASGVESAPGKKDPAKVRAFVAAAKRAFAELD